MLSKTFLTLAALLVSAVSADPRELGTVLAGNKDLSTYYSLIKVRCQYHELLRQLFGVCTNLFRQKYPEVLLQLPSYAGVTVRVIHLSASP